MIQNPSNPPVTTFSQVTAGQAFKNNFNGENYIKDANGTGVKLDTGAIDAINGTQEVTPAPNATYTMWP